MNCTTPLSGLILGRNGITAAAATAVALEDKYTENTYPKPESRVLLKCGQTAADAADFNTRYFKLSRR